MANIPDNTASGSANGRAVNTRSVTKPIQPDIGGSSPQRDQHGCDEGPRSRDGNGQNVAMTDQRYDENRNASEEGGGKHVRPARRK